MNQKLIFILLLAAGLILPGTFAQKKELKSLVNPSHLNHLYEDINVNGKEMGIIHIYADYPSYNYVEASGEGISCVDDCARALVFYMEHYEATRDKSLLNKITRLTNFLAYMQSDNGWFYNFIWKDYSRDSTYKTSVAEPSWWTWRALWALSEAQIFYKKFNLTGFNQIKPVLDKGINTTVNWLDGNKESAEIYGGVKSPAVLPLGSASDQAAVIVKAFTAYYRFKSNPVIKKEIEKLCESLMQMQAGDKNNFPYYAFLSWQNTWHMWGNSQSDALIVAGKLLNKHEYIACALKEIKNFYPYLIKNGYMNNFSIEKKSGAFLIKDSSKYSQIAYGIRPVVFACIGAGGAASVKTACEAAEWLLGKNVLGKPAYNPETGICFDGLNNADEFNKNSGAESTIEALLALHRIEQNPAAKNILLKYYNSHKN